MKSKEIYTLSEADVQTVANQEIGRDLFQEEIQRVRDSISEKINWYESIANAINETIQVKVDPPPNLH